MQAMIYTFGDAASTWICVRPQSGIYADSTNWDQVDRDTASMQQLNDSLLARGVPCILQSDWSIILQSNLCQLKVHCEDQRAQTMLLLSIPSGLLCGEPRTGAHIGTDVCEQLLTVANARGLKYTCREQRKFVI
jgi:hypothetical protein